MPWRENEGEANVFVKPDEQRLSLLRLCHGEKMKVKPTIKLLWGAYCRVTSAICPPCLFIRKSAYIRILTEKNTSIFFRPMIFHHG